MVTELYDSGELTRCRTRSFVVFNKYISSLVILGEPFSSLSLFLSFSLQLSRSLSHTPFLFPKERFQPPTTQSMFKIIKRVNNVKNSKGNY